MQSNIFGKFDSILASKFDIDLNKIPKAKKVCRLVYMDRKNNGYLNMILPEDMDEFLVYTQAMGKRADALGNFMGIPGVIWKPASEWDSFREEKIAEGWVDVTKKMVDRNKLVPTLQAMRDFSEYDAMSDASQLIDKLTALAQNAGNTSAFEKIHPEASLDTFYNTNIIIFTKKTLTEAKRFLKNLREMEIVEGTEETITQINDALTQLYINLPTVIRNNRTNDKKWLSKKLESAADIRSSLNDIIEAEEADLATVTKEQEDRLARINRPQIPEGSDTFETTINGNHITIRNADAELVNTVKDNLRSLNQKYSNCWYVTNATTQAAYEADMAGVTGDHKKEMLLWHGSATENWTGIIEEGLKISKKVAHGSMFGRGCYFAPKAIKASGYTSIDGSIWANGKSKFGYLGLYKVRVGVDKPVDSAGDYRDEILRSKKYDSVWAHRGVSNLREDEIVVYKESQCTLYALVEIKAPDVI